MRNGAICPVLHAKTQGRTLVSNTRCDAYACVSNTYTLDEEKILQEISGLLMRRKSWVQVRKLGPSAAPRSKGSKKDSRGTKHGNGTKRDGGSCRFHSEAANNYQLAHLLAQLREADALGIVRVENLPFGADITWGMGRAREVTSNEHQIVTLRGDRKRSTGPPYSGDPLGTSALLGGQLASNRSCRRLDRSHCLQSHLQRCDYFGGCIPQSRGKLALNRSCRRWDRSPSSM